VSGLQHAAERPVSTALGVEVVAPGLFTTVQDTRGRPAYQRYGVPVGGALDTFAAAAANALVGNDPQAALLEVTLAGPTLRFEAPTAFALTGADLSATIDGESIPPGWSWLGRAGAVLAFGERRSGARAYLAFAGGLAVPSVLGSRAADVRAGFPDLAGRALRAGDRLPLVGVPDVVSRCGRRLVSADAPLDRPVRVMPGPHAERFAADALDEFCRIEWEIGDQADRMGYRLVGPRLRHTHGADVTSLGLPVGAVQVPGDGRPIVLLADHQPTGGYTVPACVIRADVPLLAQRVPGDTVRFAWTTPAEAQAALRGPYAALRPVEHDIATWAGLRWAESGGQAVGSRY
jgi:antagonist of KipI